MFDTAVFRLWTKGTNSAAAASAAAAAASPPPKKTRLCTSIGAGTGGSLTNIRGAELLLQRA